MKYIHIISFKIWKKTFCCNNNQFQCNPVVEVAVYKLANSCTAFCAAQTDVFVAFFRVFSLFCAAETAVFVACYVRYRDAAKLQITLFL